MYFPLFWSRFALYIEQGTRAAGGFLFMGLYLKNKWWLSSRPEQESRSREILEEKLLLVFPLELEK